MKSKNLAFIGIFAALVIVLQAIAEITRLLGLPMSLALGLIPVLVAAQLKGPKVGAAVGLVFGLTSMTLALIAAASMPIARVTVNPLVSVVPRILVGVVCGGVYKLSARNAVSKPRRIFNSVAATLSGIITNTALYLGMFLAFAYGRTFEETTIDFKWVLASVVALNTVVEVVAFTLIVPAVVISVENWRKGNGKQI
ncbi:MAG: ECF transporter S component [Firmicutes bacterium]|uniref:ECF transporter S component n=1 Tax=Candidatus Stercoripulliclostridium pullicola TaxID=2840953 RepID=A0A940DGZ5_9FIRM|nr:ECF transporter S component [Candidatus Stercoripulliclostridium pullicola]